MGGAKKQTVGYRYFFTLQMGLGRGPINELMEIRVGDKLAWFGSATTSTTINIQAPDLFGGDKGEGGIQGVMDICMGEKTQGQNSRMTKMRGALLSAYRGVTTFVYDGLICSMNPYPKPWKFRVRRTTAGWDRAPWYPERANIYFYDDYTPLDVPSVLIGYIGNPDFYDKQQWKDLVTAQQINTAEEVTLRRRTIQAMNPAHILVECATNRSWGKGLPDDQIDWDSFKLAADTLYCEGFGLCMRWNRQSGIEDVIGEIINTIGAFQYVSRSTGKLTLRMVRSDYDPESLPVFTRTTGLLSIESNEVSGSDAGFNEVVVKYKTPLTGKVASVRYQNLGSAMSDGGINSETTEYLGIPSRNLALRVAARDVKSNTGDVRRLKLTFDRRGWPLEPGTVFVLSDPETEIGRMIMRVVTVDNEDYVQGTITVTCLTDIYGLPETTYVGSDELPDNGEDPNPKLTLDDKLVEAPYRSMYQLIDPANFNILSPASTFLAGMAARPNMSNKGFLLRTKAEGEADWGEDTLGGWADWATLSMPVGPLDEIFRIGDFYWPTENLGVVGRIDDEEVQIVMVDRVNNIVQVKRGCLDTIPAKHLKGARLWFYETDAAIVEREFVAGETLLAKFMPYTDAATLLESLAPTDMITTVGRFGSPYVPGAVTVNGVSIFDEYELETGATLAWARRNRVTQQDMVYDHHTGDISPEAGQTVTIKLFRADTDAVLETWDTLTGTTNVLDFDYAGETRLEVFSVRDTMESYQRYNKSFGYDGVHIVMVDGSDMVTVDGELIITQE